MDEAGAPEFYTSGAKLLPIAGEKGKLTAEAVAETLAVYRPREAHRVLPSVLSLTQGTEAGTVYSVDELNSLSEVAHRHGLSVHMDGARFANACAELGASPSALSRDSGIDVLTLGGTKNGCMVADAVVFFDPAMAEELAARQKRAGQGFSKHRFIAAQWAAYFENGLWLELAAHANTMADRLFEAFRRGEGYQLPYQRQINEVFVVMEDTEAARLRAAGAAFYDWIQPGDAFGRKLRRFVTSFATQAEEVDAFVDLLASA
jgi:threonine aldolase